MMRKREVSKLFMELWMICWRALARRLLTFLHFPSVVSVLKVGLCHHSVLDTLIHHKILSYSVSIVLYNSSQYATGSSCYCQSLGLALDSDVLEVWSLSHSAHLSMSFVNGEGRPVRPSFTMKMKWESIYEIILKTRLLWLKNTYNPSIPYRLSSASPGFSATLYYII